MPLFCLKCGWIPGLRPNWQVYIYHLYRLPTGTLTVYSISTKAHTSWLRNSFSWHAVAVMCYLRQKNVIFHYFHNLPLSHKLDPRLIPIYCLAHGLRLIGKAGTLSLADHWYTCWWGSVPVKIHADLLLPTGAVDIIHVGTKGGEEENDYSQKTHGRPAHDMEEQRATNPIEEKTCKVDDLGDSGR